MLKMPHSQGSLREVLSGASVNSPVALLVGQKIIGHCLAAGLQPAVATLVVSHNLWCTHVALFFLTLQQTTAQTPQPSQTDCNPKNAMSLLLFVHQCTYSLDAEHIV